MFTRFWNLLFPMSAVEKLAHKHDCEDGIHEFGRWSKSLWVQERYCKYCNILQLRYPIEGKMKQ